MEITPSSSFFDTQERPASPKKTTATSNPFDSDEDVGLRDGILEEEVALNGNLKGAGNTNNPFNDSYIGEIDEHKALSRSNSLRSVNGLTFKQELEDTVTLRTEASSSGSESGSAGSEDNSSNSGDDSDSDDGHLVPPEEPTGLLEVEVEEIAHEQEEYNLEDELQDEPLDDEPSPEELGEPIRNSVGITIGFKKIKRIAKAAKRLGKGKGKSKRASVSESGEEAEDKNEKVVQELQALLDVSTVSSQATQDFKSVATRRTSSASASVLPPPVKEVVPNQFSNIVLTSVVADIGMAAAEAAAEANGWDVTICICDTAGIPLQVKRSTNMRGSAASYDMAVQKAKMAATFAQITGQGNLSNPVPPGEEAPIDATQTALVALYPFLHIGGGFPLILNGTCCGAVGVSNGQVDICDQQQDQHVAKAGVKAMADIYWNYQVLATNEV